MEVRHCSKPKTKAGGSAASPRASPPAAPGWSVCPNPPRKRDTPSESPKASGRVALPGVGTPSLAVTHRPAAGPEGGAPARPAADADEWYGGPGKVRP